MAATLTFEGEELMLTLAASSQVFDVSALTIPASNIGEVQAKLRAALKALERT